jgi:hypothetical protein
MDDLFAEHLLQPVVVPIEIPKSKGGSPVPLP